MWILIRIKGDRAYGTVLVCTRSRWRMALQALSHILTTIVSNQGSSSFSDFAQAGVVCSVYECIINTFALLHHLRTASFPPFHNYPKTTEHIDIFWHTFCYRFIWWHLPMATAHTEVVLNGNIHWYRHDCCVGVWIKSIRQCWYELQCWIRQQFYKPIHKKKVGTRLGTSFQAIETQTHQQCRQFIIQLRSTFSWNVLIWWVLLYCLILWKPWMSTVIPLWQRKLVQLVTELLTSDWTPKRLEEDIITRPTETCDLGAYLCHLGKTMYG